MDDTKIEKLYPTFKYTGHPNDTDMPEQYFDKMTDFDMIVIDVTLPSEDALNRFVS